MNEIADELEEELARISSETASRLTTVPNAVEGGTERLLFVSRWLGKLSPIFPLTIFRLFAFLLVLLVVLGAATCSSPWEGS
jgi:hypothetical protein